MLILFSIGLDSWESSEFAYYLYLFVTVFENRVMLKTTRVEVGERRKLEY